MVGWERSVEQQGEGYSPGLVDTLRSLKEKIVSFKVDNAKLFEAQERLSKAQEKQAEFNAIILQRLSYFQK